MLEKISGFLFGWPIPTSPTTKDRIRRCPWPEDIHIDRRSWIGSGEFGSIAGRAYHSVYCVSDGPNSGLGNTMHHGFIGFWPDHFSFAEANLFAFGLWEQIRRLIGREVPVYASHVDINKHVEWCMHGTGERPAGIHPRDLPTDFESYL